MDMLHNMDACQIAQTGRGYLQVGNNEVYDLFQAGWSGAPYREECRKAVAQMINLDGTPCSVKNTFVKETFEHEKEITQLQAITKYIAHFAKEHNYRAGKQLWMDPLPRYLYLEDIIEEKEEKKEKREDKKGKEQRIQKLFCNEGIQICLGVFDDPENQEQPKFYFNLMECGHVGIGGRSVSGKSTFLQTFIFSVINKYSEKDITLYILDFNGGGMDIYAVASQVQQVIKEEEEEKTDSLFEGIREELKRRKKMLSGGNFNPVSYTHLRAHET